MTLQEAIEMVNGLKENMKKDFRLANNKHCSFEVEDVGIRKFLTDNMDEISKATGMQVFISPTMEQRDKMHKMSFAIQCAFDRKGKDMTGRDVMKVLREKFPEIQAHTARVRKTPQPDMVDCPTHYRTTILDKDGKELYAEGMYK